LVEASAGKFQSNPAGFSSARRKSQVGYPATYDVPAKDSQSVETRSSEDKKMVAFNPSELLENRKEINQSLNQLEQKLGSLERLITTLMERLPLQTVSTTNVEPFDV
jgi:hypothetical protein